MNFQYHMNKNTDFENIKFKMSHFFLITLSPPSILDDDVIAGSINAERSDYWESIHLSVWSGNNKYLVVLLSNSSPILRS